MERKEVKSDVGPVAQLSVARANWLKASWGRIQVEKQVCAGTPALEAFARASDAETEAWHAYRMELAR